MITHSKKMTNSPSSSHSAAIEGFDNFVADYESDIKENRLRVSFFLDLTREFKNLKIPVLPLKGMDLLIRAYPSAGIRPMADIDLLIERKDARKVMTILEKKGFVRRPDEGLTYLSGDQNINLDILWDFWYITDPQQIKTLWKETVTRSFKDTALELLHPEDDLIYLVSYTTAHRGVLFESFVQDLHFFLEKEGASIDWKRLAGKMKSLKLQTFCFYGFSYAIEQGVSGVPQDFMELLRPISLADKLLLFFLKRLVSENPQPKVSYFFTWLGYPGIRGKIKLLREKLFPSPFELEIQRGITTKSGYLSYFIFHPFVLVFRGLSSGLKRFFKNAR